MKKSLLILFACFAFCPPRIVAGIKPFGLIYSQRQRSGILIDKCDGRNPLTVGKRSTSPLTCMGSPFVPVVLVQFADKKFTVAETDEQVNDFYQKYLNGETEGGHYAGGGSVGAVSEYFRDQSYGQFTPVFVPIGPVTLDNGYAYYGKNSGSVKDVNINAFYTEAIKNAQDTFTGDWSKFDNNDNGVIDMVFFIYAGRGENDSKDRDVDAIWPKENGGGGTIGGLKYGAYACCNELQRTDPDGIGVMCHELSHALGLPDLYDTNMECFGLDYWDLMDAGSYCANGRRPCGYSAYEKDFMGWRQLIELTPGEEQHLTLYPMSSDLGYGYKIVNPENPDEYYIIENRQNEGWDKNIGYSTTTYGYFHGLLVTHIDYLEGRWTSNTVNTNSYHQCCTLIPADGHLDSSIYVGEEYSVAEYMKSMGGDPFPGTAYVREDNGFVFEPIDSLVGSKATVFTTTGETPGLMNQPIYNITEHEGGVITLDFCPNVADGIESHSVTEGQDNRIYNMQGMPVGRDYKGIVIRNGKKVVQN